MACVLIRRDQRVFRTRAKNLTHAAQVQNQIFHRRDAPARQDCCKRGVLVDFLPAKLQRRIQQKQRPPAIFHVGFQRIDFRI